MTPTLPRVPALLGCEFKLWATFHASLGLMTQADLWQRKPTPQGGTSVNTRKLFTLILFVLVTVATLAAEGDCETRNDPARPTARPTATPTVSIADIRDMVISSIEGYPRVREASIGQDGKQLSLVIIVDYATDPGYAQELGDNFVRLAKTFLKDGAPGKQIGTGKYDYLIGVYYPNEQKVALGAKVRSADRISW